MPSQASRGGWSNDAGGIASKLLRQAAYGAVNLLAWSRQASRSRRFALVLRPGRRPGARAIYSDERVVDATARGCRHRARRCGRGAGGGCVRLHDSRRNGGRVGGAGSARPLGVLDEVSEHAADPDTSPSRTTAIARQRGRSPVHVVAARFGKRRCSEHPARSMITVVHLALAAAIYLAAASADRLAARRCPRRTGGSGKIHRRTC